jgi:hypothetical protein
MSENVIEAVFLAYAESKRAVRKARPASLRILHFSQFFGS